MSVLKVSTPGGVSRGVCRGQAGGERGVYRGEGLLRLQPLLLPAGAGPRAQHLLLSQAVGSELPRHQPAQLYQVISAGEKWGSLVKISPQGHGQLGEGRQTGTIYDLNPSEENYLGKSLFTSKLQQ